MSAYEDNYNGTIIHLIDGGEFDFQNPLDLDLGEDALHTIAHALAREQRFGGHHGAPAYSVAEHATIVAWLVQHYYNEPDYALAALHHDDAEFVTKDIPTPMKNWLKSMGVPWKALETDIMTVISRELAIPMDNFKAGVIKDADVMAYAAEIELMKPRGHGADPEVDPEVREKVKTLIQALLPEDAERAYILSHKFLNGEIEIQTMRMKPKDDMPADPFNGPQPEIPNTLPENWDLDDPADPRS